MSEGRQRKAGAPAPKRGAQVPPVKKRTSATKRTSASREGIKDAIEGVSLSIGPVAPAGGDGKRSPQGGRVELHPSASGTRMGRPENMVLVDPRLIVLEGIYVRQFIHDADFDRLRLTVRANRDIGQPIGFRRVGESRAQERYVLIYGMRRLKAALDAGLEKIPARDYGAISEAESIRLQMEENEMRSDPHNIDIAYGFYLLKSESGMSQTDIVRRYDEGHGRVSVLVRVGEALALMSEEERLQFHRLPHRIFRPFQEIAQVRSVEERKEALFELLNAPMSEEEDGEDLLPQKAKREGEGSDGAAQAAGERKKKPADDSLVQARVLRNGRVLRVRWTDNDLKESGDAVAEEFLTRFLEEYQLILERTALIKGEMSAEGNTPPPAYIKEKVLDAAKSAELVDKRIRGSDELDVVGAGNQVAEE